MPQPWDIAPIPAQGDERSENTFAAKGRAVSQWEVVEVAFSGLYAVLSGLSRLNPKARQEYGTLLNFKDRLTQLERVGCAYFIKHCDQEAEGDFAWLCGLARHLSVRRNELTHSWVRPVAFARTYRKVDSGGDQTTTKYRFFLVPATYTSRKFDLSDQPEFIYTSVEIEAYCEAFLKLGFDVNRLATVLENPAMRAYADKPLLPRHELSTDRHPTAPSGS